MDSEHPSVTGFLRSGAFAVVSILAIALLGLYYALYNPSPAATLALTETSVSPCRPPSKAIVVCSVAPPIVAPGDAVTVEFAAGDDSAVDPKTFRLRLGEKIFTDIVPEQPAAAEVLFRLPDPARADQSHDINASGWGTLLGSPPVGGVRVVDVGLSANGIGLTTPLGADGRVRPLTVALRIFPPALLLVAVVAAALLLSGVLYLAAQTDLLRDAREVAPKQRKPFSLAKCQMAFWFFLVTGLFLFIAVVTWGYNGVVTSQSLLLLGISSATALGATQIDQAHASGQKDQPVGPPHVSLLNDLLTDDTGYAFHRIQVLVWTLILGAISVISAYRALTLPNFDTQLLLMMGISNGLYLGFKYPEAQTATVPQDNG